MEIWKDIPNYEGVYQVSNCGNVKSLARKRHNQYSCFNVDESILTQNTHRCGYLWVGLSREGKRKSFYVHRLVMLAFDKHSNLQVDHKDGNKQNNNLENLRYVSNRENCISHHKKANTFKGYTFDKRKNKYAAQIYHNKKHIFLGYFDNPEQALQAYQNKLQTII
jgi:hypothetical protein